MQLILTSVHDKNEVTDKDHLILIIDTETKEIKWIPLDISDSGDLIGSKSICISGDYLIVSLSTRSKTDKLLVINLVTKRNSLTTCIKSKEIHSMVSVFRGRIYCISTENDTMNNIVLSPSTNNIMRDVIHYSFDGGNDKHHLSSLINWDRRWFVSSFGEGWKEEDFSNGSILELSKNNRSVYSNINQPNSLFFNRRDEMCFCESGNNLFHFGRNIVYINGGYLRGVIEDHYDNGYWIGVSASRKVFPLIPARLVFVNYDGFIEKEIVIPHTYDIYGMVEAQGYLSKLL